MIVKTLAVICNGCSQWVDGGVDVTSHVARTNARGHSGYILYGGEDLCPWCQEEREVPLHKRPGRICPLCSGYCRWVNDAWVCDDCGDEPGVVEYGPEFAAP